MGRRRRVKKDSTSRPRAITGTTNVPLMAWIMNPAISGKGVASLCISEASATPPPMIQVPRPAMAQATAIAWTATSTAIAYASTR